MENNSVGLSGEYFVAAELYRRGYSVGITMGNAKSVDILAIKNDKSFQIQVKSIRDKRSVNWTIKKQDIKEEIFYIFVNLNCNDLSSPDFYILKGTEVLEIIRPVESGRDYINLGVLKNANCVQSWEKIS